MESTTERVVEQLGLQFEADGMPRIAGRILGYLLLSAEPRCLDRLSEDLLISKTSASTNARFLVRMGALERTGRPGDRRDFYRVSPTLHVRILAHRMDRIRSLLRVMSEARGSSAADVAGVKERLDLFTHFFEHMLEVVGAARGRWEKEHEDHADPGLAARAIG